MVIENICAYTHTYPCAQGGNGLHKALYDIDVEVLKHRKE